MDVSIAESSVGARPCDVCDGVTVLRPGRGTAPPVTMAPSYHATQVGQGYIDLGQAKCVATVAADPANAAGITKAVDATVSLNTLAVVTVGQCRRLRSW